MKILVIAFLICLSIGYTEINDLNKYKQFAQQFSIYPILHVLYDKSYKKTKYFEDFVEILSEVQLQVKDFAKIIVTDCSLAKNFEQCDFMRQSNDNLYISGIKPNQYFLKLENKKLQKSPEIFRLEDENQRYSQFKLLSFIQSITPNYFTELRNQQDLQEFLNSRHVPKLIYFTNEEEIPINIKKISVLYHLRFDMANVQDLTDSIVSIYTPKKYPSLLYLKFNYQTKTFDKQYYRGSLTQQNQFIKLKQFLDNKALKYSRNDILFHKIKKNTNQIITVDDYIQLQKLYDSAPGWIITLQSQEPTQLRKLNQKYSAYFTYIHLKKKSQSLRLSLYNPVLNTSYVFTEDIKFNPLNYDDFVGNVSGLANQNYTVLGVRQKYSHVCAIVLQTFFRGLVQCFIIRDQDYKKFSTQMKIEFDQSFVTFRDNKNGDLKVQKLKTIRYEQVYQSLQYLIKMRLQELMIDFMNNPVKHIDSQIEINELCNDAKKKCLIGFLNKNKAQYLKSELSYLQQIAQQYFSDYIFYWVDRQCNSQLINKLGQPKLTLLLYVRQQLKYLSLKQKLGKVILKKFLKKAQRQKNSYKYLNQNIFPLIINSCKLDHQL